MDDVNAQQSNANMIVETWDDPRVNVEKTKYNKRKHMDEWNRNVTIGNEIKEKVNELKYLGA